MWTWLSLLARALRNIKYRLCCCGGTIVDGSSTRANHYKCRQGIQLYTLRRAQNSVVYNLLAARSPRPIQTGRLSANRSTERRSAVEVNHSNRYTNTIDSLFIYLFKFTIYDPVMIADSGRRNNSQTTNKTSTRVQ